MANPMVMFVCLIPVLVHSSQMEQVNDRECTIEFQEKVTNPGGQNVLRKVYAQIPHGYELSQSLCVKDPQNFQARCAHGQLSTTYPAISRIENTSYVHCDAESVQYGINHKLAERSCIIHVNQLGASRKYENWALQNKLEVPVGGTFKLANLSKSAVGFSSTVGFKFKTITGNEGSFYLYKNIHGLDNAFHKDSEFKCVANGSSPSLQHSGVTISHGYGTTPDKRFYHFLVEPIEPSSPGSSESTAAETPTMTS